MAVVKETNRLKEQGVKPTEKETEAIREAVRVRELSSRRRAAAEEEAKAYENIWTTAANSIGNALDNAFRQFIDKRKVDVGNLAKSIATDIGSALIKATVTVPVTNFIKQLAGFAFGGTFANGHEVVAMANGRVLNRAAYVPMADGRVAMMGESGEEAVMPLRRGADGKLGVHANGAGSGVTFQVFDQRSVSAAPVETRESRGPDGSRLVQVLIRDGVRSAIANGDVDSEMRGAFGVQRPVASR
jgi:phage-related minor tail protein